MKVVIQISLGALFSVIVLLTPGHCKDVVGDREIKVFLNPENLFTAFENCKYLGMDLLMIHNSAEELKVIELLKMYKMNSVWLATTDLGHDYLFISLLTGERLKYSNWLPGEPNNQVGSEHCVNLWLKSVDLKGWNDTNCLIKLPYFCEMPVVSKRACEVTINPTCKV